MEQHNFLSYQHEEINLQKRIAFLTKIQIYNLGDQTIDFSFQYEGIETTKKGIKKRAYGDYKYISSEDAKKHILLKNPEYKIFSDLSCRPYCGLSTNEFANLFYFIHNKEFSAAGNILYCTPQEAAKLYKYYELGEKFQIAILYQLFKNGIIEHCTKKARAGVQLLEKITGEKLKIDFKKYPNTLQQLKECKKDVFNYVAEKTKEYYTPEAIKERNDNTTILAIHENFSEKEKEITEEIAAANKKINAIKYLNSLNIPLNNTYIHRNIYSDGKISILFRGGYCCSNKLEIELIDNKEKFDKMMEKIDIEKLDSVVLEFSEK